MTPNRRGPIYASIQAARGRQLSPSERELIDAALDVVDVPRRGR